MRPLSLLPTTPKEIRASPVDDEVAVHRLLRDARCLDRNFFRCPVPPQTTNLVTVSETSRHSGETTMYEIRALNPDAITAELAYRRQQLVGNRVGPPQPRGRWWRRRTQITD